ncbi:glycoside hydrolase family 2 protein [Paenibacillus sacheonensis]|uniref:Glycoside hydrolase family 2 n=1 Tax=Paenibacillus sacheonensis TaxID=742054 RepID=A0A7X4YRQ8_9BACL|nr:sugar-binding domain-containing protein [Paenibacillus sacheonensis]MBM7564927.1 beta-galactosidase/beta-glucuronidase [Paenibacillus sacheonensis]NBC70284.1 glycoside hydrolase family 2 [Paenibacillus sacheonensis]
MTEQLRAEHPYPQFMRNEWVNLNGEWEFEFDDDNAGAKAGWHAGTQAFSKRIQVPFAYQSKLSGIGDPGFHDTVWYRTELRVPADFAGKRVLLHFGAVDYEASVWVNGALVAQHEGGHTPFRADITDALQAEGNVLVVKAVDYGKDVTIPRGKQYWEEQSASIFYTRTTGIWQTVWLEAVSSVHLDKVKLTPDIDRKEIRVTAFVKGAAAGSQVRVKAEITFNGKPVSEDVFALRSGSPSATRAIRIDDFNDHGLGGWWSPENPNLYDVTFTLLEGEEVRDVVSSYFGMRKVSIESGKLCLNNRPYYLRMVLDQGYFPDGNLTPPSDEAIKRDVELTKAMGFNGARKHQKLEDPRYLYWCDKLGVAVWSEAANAYEYSDEYVRRFTNEWLESVERDYNHPSIVAWVPINESWGVPDIQLNKLQQQHALAMYHMTKSLDEMRPVISNDGWELVTTDLFNIHDYEGRREVLMDRYSTAEKAVSAMPANRVLAVEGFPYAGQPILISEFGGISYKKSDWEGWGYTSASDDEDFIKRLRDVVQPMYLAGVVQGFCYTQLTDVEQEINGLLTYDRVPKLPLETIKAIVEGK